MYLSTTTWLRPSTFFGRGRNRFRVVSFVIFSQGSPADGTTLGFGAESLWDSVGIHVGNDKGWRRGLLSCASPRLTTNMDPKTIAANYDALAHWYQRHVDPAYGLSALERALRLSSASGRALDVGCGSEGRFIKRLAEHGFQTDGVDISANMIALARKQCPDTSFYVADINEWPLPHKYSFISAWDSTFHLPLHQQEPVLKKLCEGLLPNGILLFTCGGGEPGEITGHIEGREFGYSTLGASRFVELLQRFSCRCIHLEYDQWPENHVFIIAQAIR